MASKNGELASAIAQAVYDVDSSLILYGLASSELVRAGNEAGLTVAQEVFADRTYQRDGSLTSRKQEHAMIEEHAQSLQQVIRMIIDGTVDTRTKKQTYKHQKP